MSNDCQRQDLEIAFAQHRTRLREVTHAIVSVPDVVGDVMRESAILARHLIAIDKALGSLSPRTRTAFMLYRSKELTQHEISRKLGVPPAVVSAMIGEAIDVLKQCRALFAAD